MTEISQVIAGLRSQSASVRLAAAMRAGTAPQSEYLPVLVQRCGIEPDFFVRDMLTWALIQNDETVVIELVLPELVSPRPQARSQALHTLSKVGDPAVWSSIPKGLVFDPGPEVARTAWRAMAGLAPEQERVALADDLVTQLGRGDRQMMLSLSRALAQLGDAARPAVRRAQGSSDDVISAHARATERLLDDPEADLGSAVETALRARALRDAPMVDHVDR